MSFISFKEEQGLLQLEEKIISYMIREDENYDEDCARKDLDKLFKGKLQKLADEI